MLVTERFQLPATAKTALRFQTVPWGFGKFSEVIYYRTYSRLLVTEGRFETWPETVIRCVEGALSILQNHALRNGMRWDADRWQREARRMAQFMFEMKFTPPGRGLWLMGTDHVYRQGSAGLNNCFAGSERLFTAEHGLVTLREVAGQTVTVMTEIGWQSATVRSFGVQPLQRVTFAPAIPTPSGAGWRALRSNRRVSYTVTPDHRWPLVNGRVVTSLAVGDVVPAMGNVAIDRESDEYRQGMRHGLVFADGNRTYAHVGNNAFNHQLRLCGRKGVYRDLFSNVTYPPSAHGDPVAQISSTIDMKALPDSNVAPDYLAGFVQGWLVGDASLKENQDYVCYRLSTQNSAAAEWLKETAPVAGFVVTGEHIESTVETNYGERSAPLIRLSVVPAETAAWKVVSVQPLAAAETVYCATVPDVGFFTLAGGVYTSNCGFVDVLELSRDAAWLMDHLMLGVGVGFSTHRATFTLFRPDPETVQIVQIPDSREGWVQSVQTLIASYEQPNGATVAFDYAIIRPAGSRINGFGGTASGPAPLRLLHERLRRYLDAHVDGRTSRVRLIADVMNAIGCCVVAGNVRRSAEIALGSPNDHEFINLKNYGVFDRNNVVIERGPAYDRRDIGWMSNNSIVLEHSDDFDVIPEMAARASDNGEPGIINLINVRKFGRVGKDFAERGDLREDLAVGINPCAEIPLESTELCNLVEVFPSRCADEAEFLEAVRLATIYATAVSLLPSHDPRTNDVVNRNRRIGVSLSGIADWMDATPSSRIVPMLRKGYTTARATNRAMAREFDVPEAIRVTTVKPSGTVSLLAGVSPGMHWPLARWNYRTVRVAADSPLSPLLAQAGVPAEPDINDPDGTLVFTFPIEYGSGRTRSIPEVGIWQQGMTLVMLQREWADNAVSNTLTFHPRHEKDHVERMIAMVAPQVKSLSVLPDMDAVMEMKGLPPYPQAPFQKVTKAQYKELFARIKPIDWSNYLGSGSGIDPSILYCESDKCEIPDLTNLSGGGGEG